MTKYICLLLLFVGTVLCSCTNNKTLDEISKENTPLLAELKFLSDSKTISTEDFQQSVNNIVSYEQNSIWGKHGKKILLGALLVLYIGIIVGVSEEDEEMLVRPLTKVKGYILLLFFGILGAHLLYVKKLKWLSYLSIMLTIVFYIWHFKYIMYFWDIPNLMFVHNSQMLSLPTLDLFYKSELMLFGLYGFNIVVGVIFLPYWLYQYNGLYFRQQKDNDAILKGKELEVDIFYNSKLLPDIKETSEDAETTIEVINNEDFIVEDENDEKIDGFFKRFLTLRNSSTLKRKVQRLRALRYCCENISENLDNLDKDNTVLFSYLKYYRVAAYRNLYLAKELIGVVKDKVSSQEQKLIVDEFPELTKPQNSNPSDVYFDASQTSFNSDRFLESVGLSLSSSFDNLSEKIGKEKELAKEDFIEAGIEIAIDSLIAGITEVFDMYSRTKENIRDVEVKISEAINYLSKACPSINNYKAELIRQSEIMIALYKCNRAFVMAYEPLRQKIFGRPTFSQFIRGINKDQQYFKSDGFRRDLQHLIMVCSKYNRIYNAKTGNDESKIIKPVYQEKKQAQEKKETKNPSPSQNEMIGSPQIRQQVLDLIRDNLKKDNITESSTIKSLKLDKGYNKRALCIRINDSYSTKMAPEQFEQFLQVKDIINYVIRNKK